VVVVVNSFPTDTPAEHALIRDAAREAGAFASVVHAMHAGGGMGGIELAEAVAQACERPSELNFTYEDGDLVETKIEKIATTLYGAAGVEFSPAARRSIATFSAMGYGTLPVCMAKTRMTRLERALPPVGTYTCATFGCRRARGSCTRCAETS
jgi:formate--tetrahydrofolate ligase